MASSHNPKFSPKFHTLFLCVERSIFHAIQALQLDAGHVHAVGLIRYGDGPEFRAICGDSSAEDCALLAASNEAMAGVTSYTAAATYDFNMVGVPGTPADASVLVEVAGAFNMDEAAQAALAAVNGLSQDEMMAAIAENPQALVDIVNGLDAELALTYTVNDELAALLSGEVGMELPSSANVATVSRSTALPMST